MLAGDSNVQSDDETSKNEATNKKTGGGTVKGIIGENGNHKPHNNKETVSLLKPNIPEVTFCNISDNNSSFASLNGKKTRKRFITNDLHSSESLSSSSTGESKKKPEIPDGGFGWVVVFASFMISLIADGVSFSFGLIYTELLSYFEESVAKTAWIGSLFLAVPLLVGPVMSNLVDKYGCRRMTIIGGILQASGFALASICNSIEALYLTFGILAGLGLGIGYVTAVVSIAFWFDKKRTLATSIGAAGTGVGTFLYAPLTNFLIEYYYGWRGATLIIAGTMLHACIFGALMRDPDWLIEENRLESRSQSMTTFSNSSVCLDEIKKLLDSGITKEAVLDTLVTNYNTEANQQILDPEHSGKLKKYKSEIFLPTYLSSLDLGSIDEIKRVSRRSLRQKPELDTISRENLLSLSSGGGGAGGNPASTTAMTTLPTDNLNENTEKKKYLASVETLSPSEKLSTLPNTPLKSSIASIQTNNSYDERYNIMKSVNIRQLNGSRFSLNENMIMKKNSASLTDIKRKQNRGNSLDILYNDDDDYYYDDDIRKRYGEEGPNDTSKLLRHNEHKEIILAPLDTKQPNGIVIPIPEGMELSNMTGAEDKSVRRRSPKKKTPDSNRRFSLKRNMSLKNANYLRNMRIHRNSIHYRGALLNTHRYRLRASSCPNIYRNSMTTIAKEDEDTWYDNFVDIIKSIFDFSLFLDLKFTIFNLSTLLLFIWFIIPYFYITEHMKVYGYVEQDSANLISVIGIFNTIGMVGLGFIGDKPWVNVNVTYGVCLVLCGLSVFLMPIFVTSYAALVALSVLFGLTFASTFSFTPSILVSLIDLDDFTCAYGLVLLVQGVGSLVGPPLAGVIYDITHRWDDSFYAAGFFIAISGVLAYIIDVLERRDEKRKKTRSQHNSSSSESEP